jgi:hypothetical protein
VDVVVAERGRVRDILGVATCRVCVVVPRSAVRPFTVGVSYSGILRILLT